MKNILKYFTIKTKRRPKISNKVWISLREIPKYFNEIVWLADLKDFKKELHMLQTKVCFLVKHSGFQFTFMYLKLVMHFTVSALSGRPVLVSDQKGPYISLDAQGYPRILPKVIRNILISKPSSKIVGAILSLISIFRVFPTHVKPSYESVTDPFSGTSRSLCLDVINRAVKDIFPKGLDSRLRLSLIGGESAGPNGWKAVWMAGLDALAFLHNPRVLRQTIVWLWRYGKPFLAWFLLLLCLGCIPYLILLVLYPMLRRHPILLGKLSVVYNTPGKARVVALTNWWIQLMFKPLHDRLFNLLKEISHVDGTFDQDLALKKFLERTNSDNLLSSYDLSSATDRLPINLQQDILNVLSKSDIGSIWGDIISNIDWYIPDEDRFVRYAVGQPMGAYSSWAMLAITHHVIVRAASTKVNLVGFDGYVVLGDDFAINNDIVGPEYLKLMDALGVKINLSKSVISKEFCEFAKRLKGPNVDYTPIGPGLILRFIRDRFYIGNVIREAHKLNWISNISDVLIPMISRWPKRSSLLSFVLWVCLGHGGAFVASPTGMDHPLMDRIIPTFIGRYIALDNIDILNRLQLSIGNAFIKVIRRDLQAKSAELEKAKEYFYLNWYDTFVSRHPIRILELILLLVNPGLWYIAMSFDTATIELEAKFQRLNRGFATWSDISDLIALDEDLNIASIDWTQRKAVQSFRARADLFLREAQANWDFFDPKARVFEGNITSVKGRMLKPRIRVAIF